MKKLILLLVAILSAQLTSAQSMRDVVYLKSGSVIKGIITEQYPDSLIKIKISDGSIMAYKTSEIEKMLREEMPSIANALKEKPNTKEYGGHFGIGVAIGGGGILGVPMRVGLSNMFVLEAGVFLRPSYYYKKTKTTHKVIDNNGNVVYEYYDEKEDQKFACPPMIAGGANIFFGENYNERSGKIVRNGMTFKVGHTITPDFTENMYAVGWARERFLEKRKRQSYILELGLGVLHYGGDNSPLGEEIDEDIPAIPIIFWKFHWNWYVVK